MGITALRASASLGREKLAWITYETWLGRCGECTEIPCKGVYARGGDGASERASETKAVAIEPAATVGQLDSSGRK